MKVGFSSACITPRIGKEIPGLFERRIAQGVHDDLFARAVVVDDGRKVVALVQTDAIAIPFDIVMKARPLAHKLCGIPESNCMIAVTHTHSGGPTFGGFLSKEDEGYCRFVTEQVASAIADAYRVRIPALVGTGAAAADGVAFNRRFVMRNGLQRTHPGKMNPGIVAPAGPEDPMVTVVGFCEPKTFRPIGCIVNFACHATHMNGFLYSADYVRFVVDTLRAVYGPDFGVAYLNGACGDVTQVDNRSPRPAEFGEYWCERTGRVIGGGALQALTGLDYFSKATVDRRTSKLWADIRECSPEAVREARALVRENKVTAANIETIYANELLKVEALRREFPYRRLEIMSIRIADAMLWGVPGELFQQFALEVRAASPFPHTCCVELANGFNGYICTKEAFAGGGYETRIARSSLLEQDTGENIVRVAKILSRRLYDSAADEVRSLPGKRVWPVVHDGALDGIQQMNNGAASKKRPLMNR